jgi:hypothetical protein
MKKIMQSLILCMFILVLAPFVSANAVIVNNQIDAHGCYQPDGGKSFCNVLQVDLTSGQSAAYTVDGVEAGQVYTVSFRYKVDGTSKFKFQISNGVTDLIGTPDNLDSGEWTRYAVTLPPMPPVTGPFKLKFTAVDRSATFYLDEIQMTPSPEVTEFNNFRYDQGCCPFDYCYTGGMIPRHPSCIHSKFYEKNVSMPPIGWDLADFGAIARDSSTLLDAPNGYRCINGTWKFSRAKFTPLYDGAGYCPHDSQCFIGGNSPDSDIACVESGSVNSTLVNGQKEYFYCYEGNWTTRTKEIALQMLNMANQSSSNIYTIFCDKYQRSLNPDQTLTYFRDFVGDNVVAVLESGMAEEFCVMELNGKVIAGVSLNNDINETGAEGNCVPGGASCWTLGACDANGCLKDNPTSPPVRQRSFIEMLKGPDDVDYCNALLEDGAKYDGNYYPCESTNKDVYYNPKLRNVIFSKPTAPTQSVPFPAGGNVGMIERIFDYLKSVFQRLLGISGLATPQSTSMANLDFIKKAGSFDKIYISHFPATAAGQARDIRAVREARYSKIQGQPVKLKSFIAAEYQNYKLEFCNYFYFRLHNDLIKQISNISLIRCTPVILNNEEWMYSIYVEEPAFEAIPARLYDVRIWKGASDTFWNDITSKIRTQDSPSLGTAAPSKPEFNWSNNITLANTNFTITSLDGDFIARTWDFDDSTMDSSAYNITTKHVFKASRGYDVQLCVMNRNFRITCNTHTVPVGPAPKVNITWDNANKRATFTFSGGTPSYSSIRIDWNDTTFDNRDSVTTTPLVITHPYDRRCGGSTRCFIKVTGSDSTPGEQGIQISGMKEIDIS